MVEKLAKLAGAMAVSESVTEKKEAGPRFYGREFDQLSVERCPLDQVRCWLMISQLHSAEGRVVVDLMGQVDHWI